MLGRKTEKFGEIHISKYSISAEIMFHFNNITACSVVFSVGFKKELS